MAMVQVSCNRVLLPGCLAVGLILGGLVAAFSYFGWPVFFGLVGLAALGAFLAKRALRRFLLAPFLAKGRVLDGADFRVLHAEYEGRVALPRERDDDVDVLALPQTSGEVATPPIKEDDDDYVHRYLVEAEITPSAQGGGAFQLWEPGELRPVAFDSVPSRDPEADSADDLGHVAEVRVWDGAEWREDEVGKYPGGQRIQLVLHLQAATERFKLRYYFTDLGEVRTAPVIDV